MGGESLSSKGLRSIRNVLYVPVSSETQFPLLIKAIVKTFLSLPVLIV